MGFVRHLERPDRTELASLFAAYRYDRCIVDAVLQGHCGTAVADASTGALVAQLKVGPFTFFGGDASHPYAPNLVEALSGPAVISVPDAGWRDVLMRAHGRRLRAEQRLQLSPRNLDAGHLRRLKSRAPEGYHVERINIDLAQRIPVEVSSDLILPEVFASTADFVDRGVGFCAMVDDRIVCGASSAFICDGAIAIQINTNKSFRQRGLATAVAATLIVHCLEDEIEPHWDTANPASEQLAKTLGYLADGTHEWWMLPRVSHDN